LQLSTTGKMIVPLPILIRMSLRYPYTTSASCGPALRYNRANMPIKNIKPTMPSPTMIQRVVLAPPNISPPRLTRCHPRQSFSRVGQFFPAANVRHAALITRDHHFHAFGQRLILLAARGARFTDSFLVKDDLPRAVHANRDAHPCKHAHHLVVEWIQILLVGHQHFCYEDENDRRRHQPCDRRNNHSGKDPDMSQMHKQISCAAEPS